MASKLNLKKKLEEFQTALYLVPSEDYTKIILKSAKELSSNSIAYVTLNKTSDSLTELFKKKKINTKKILFIDAISHTFKKTANSENSVYCSSPGSLTEISIAINKILKKKFDYLIFDSISSLLIYEKKSPVSKFISSLVNKIKNSKTKAAFFALSSKDKSDIIKECSMFVDVVIDLEKIK
jgi:KaiC/GvpD/RAD55 family RecA-like ATPase